MTANEAIEILLLIRKLVLHNYSWVDVTEDMIRESFNMAISALEPETNTGKWVEIQRKVVNPLTGQGGVYVGCSECGAPIPTDSQLDSIDESDVRFCYVCGVEMVKW